MTLRMNRLLLTALFVCILLLPLGLRNLIERVPFAEIQRPNGSLTAMEERQLDVYLESIRLFITIATLLFAGLGFFLSTSKGGRASLINQERHLIYAAMALAFVTIVLGQISYEMLIWMLSTTFFNLDSPALHWSQTLQFWALLLSVAFFGVFAVKTLRGGGLE